jgi:type IV secretion system protein VirB10
VGLASETPASGYDTTEQALTIRAGTKFKAVLETPVSTKLSEAGDLLYWTLHEPLRIDKKHVLPRGTEFSGRVTFVKRPGRVKGKAQLYALMDGLETHYGTEPIIVSVDAADNWAADEKIHADKEGKLNSNRGIGHDLGKAVEVAELGAIVSIPIALGTTSTLPFIVGPAAGALAAVLLTRGKEIRLPVGTIFRMKFIGDLDIPVSVADVYLGGQPKPVPTP